MSIVLNLTEYNINIFYMENDLSGYRKSYEKGALLKANVPENPLELFQKWFYEVE